MQPPAAASTRRNHGREPAGACPRRRRRLCVLPNPANQARALTIQALSLQILSTSSALWIMSFVW